MRSTLATSGPGSKWRRSSKMLYVGSSCLAYCRRTAPPCSTSRLLCKRLPGPRAGVGAHNTQCSWGNSAEACSRAACCAAVTMRATLPSMSPTVKLSWARVMRSMVSVLHVENLTQVGQVGFIVAQRLARRVRQLGHGLPVGAHKFHHDVERLVVCTHVVGQVGANAKAELCAVAKVAVQHEGAFQVESVREHQPLGVCVDAQPGVVREGLFAPRHRDCRVGKECR